MRHVQEREFPRGSGAGSSHGATAVHRGTEWLNPMRGRARSGGVRMISRAEIKLLLLSILDEVAE